MSCAPHRPPGATRRTSAGFTLIELMFALTIGSIALTAIYTVVGGSTRVFHEQHRIAGMQTSVRRAMAKVTRDIQRAGFLATPSVREDLTCDIPGSIRPPLVDSVIAGARFAAIAYWAETAGLIPAPNDESEPLFAGAAVPDAMVRTDVLTLLGNYETNAQYAGAAMSVGVPNRVELDPRWHAFERDFTNWGSADPGTPAVVDFTSFADAFMIGRMVRILMLDGTKHFAIITGIADDFGCKGTGQAWGPLCVTFDPGIPNVNGCIQKAMSRLHVAPLSFIQYRLQTSLDVAGRVGSGTEEELVTAKNLQLQRMEMDPRNPLVPLPGGNRSALLDFATMFNVVFLGNTNPDPAGADIVQRTVPINPMGLQDPEDVRSVIVELAARSPLQDPRFPWIAGGDPVQQFRPFDDRPGASRVRYQRAEVFVPNVARRQR